MLSWELEMKKERSKGILWRILFGLSLLLIFAWLELGKHTVWGWVLTALAFAGWYVVRTRVWEKWNAGRKWLARGGMLAVLAVTVWISWPPVQPVPAVRGGLNRTTGIVHVEQGDLTGVLTKDGKVEVYAGIPYAQPPLGDLRWKEPRKALPWKGVLKADHFAPMSMQTQNLPIVDSLTQIIGYHDYEISLSDNTRAPVSEDSLYLNIWKPAGEAEKLPVLVYIHGGSLQSGQPWWQDYSGRGLAEKGIIVVNMGYRLGIFGFFADEALSQESPNGTTGNYGLLDQICAIGRIGLCERAVYVSSGQRSVPARHRGELNCDSEETGTLFQKHGGRTQGRQGNEGTPERSNGGRTPKAACRKACERTVCPSPYDC